MLSMQVCYVRLDEIKKLYNIRMMLCGNTSSNIFGKSYFIHKVQGFGVKNVNNFVRKELQSEPRRVSWFLNLLNKTAISV